MAVAECDTNIVQFYNFLSFKKSHSSLKRDEKLFSRGTTQINVYVRQHFVSLTRKYGINY
jgi:hypothetical protein